MARTIFSYFTTLAIFFAIDLVWLAWIAKPTYTAELGELLRKEPNLIAAAAFYVLYAAGLTLFVVMPGLEADSLLQSMAMGAAFGLVAYGTYDLTNLAVMNGYSVRIALIDIAWGACASSAAAVLAVFAVGAAIAK